jgi:UDP-N-acetylmuramoyl-tripeptide--D-alanyl-D-alanine ligase
MSAQGPLDLRVEDLVRALDGAASLSPTVGLGAALHGVSTDSRSTAPGDVFFALRGENFCGNRFVGDALARGATLAVARADVPVEAPPGAPIVLVDDPLRALGALAAEYRSRLSASVVGITGSAGKTTTRELVRQLLAGEGEMTCAEKSFNNAVGVPLTILRASRETRFLLCEVGTSAPGEIRALTRIVRPDVAVVTNVVPAHLEGLGSLEGIAREKAALVGGMRPGGVAVLNAQDPRVRAMAPEGRPTVLYGDVEDAHVRISWAPRPRGGLLEVSTRSGERHRVKLPFPGRHNAQNAAAALATCFALGVPLERAVPRLAAATLPPRRQQVLRIGDFEVIDDAYNANPASVKAAIDVLAAMPSGRKIVVLGGMHELGPRSASLHGGIGTYAAARDVDLLLTVGALAEPAVRAARAAGLSADRARACADVDGAARLLLLKLRAGDHVLVKASRSERLERLVDALRDGIAKRARGSDSGSHRRPQHPTSGRPTPSG